MRTWPDANIKSKCIVQRSMQLSNNIKHPFEVFFKFKEPSSPTSLELFTDDIRFQRYADIPQCLLSLSSYGSFYINNI
ncbi:hypothetical protein Xenpb_02708 [Xenorhabdus sp. PB62.4]|nr:hypothetical protein [Xenorhabdus sp. PB62.4]